MANTNEQYLNSIKNRFDSLKDFQIINNVLMFKKNNLTYQLPLFINLNSFNVALFYLDPEEIINVLYVYQLLYNTELTDKEQNIIIKYTDKYFEYSNNPEINSSNTFGLSIPIYTAYDDQFVNSPGAAIIRNHLAKKNEALEEYQNSIAGKEKQMIRALKKDSLSNTEAYHQYEDFSEKLNNIQNAGFTTILLITLTVITTTMALLIFS